MEMDNERLQLEELLQDKIDRARYIERQLDISQQKLCISEQKVRELQQQNRTLRWLLAPVDGALRVNHTTPGPGNKLPLVAPRRCKTAPTVPIHPPPDDTSRKRMNSSSSDNTPDFSTGTKSRIILWQGMNTRQFGQSANWSTTSAAKAASSAAGGTSCSTVPPGPPQHHAAHSDIRTPQFNIQEDNLFSKLNTASNPDPSQVDHHSVQMSSPSPNQSCASTQPFSVAASYDMQTATAEHHATIDMSLCQDDNRMEVDEPCEQKYPKGRQFSPNSSLDSDTLFGPATPAKVDTKPSAAGASVRTPLRPLALTPLRSLQRNTARKCIRLSESPPEERRTPMDTPKLVEGQSDARPLVDSQTQFSIRNNNSWRHEPQSLRRLRGCKNRVATQEDDPDYTPSGKMRKLAGCQSERRMTRGLSQTPGFTEDTRAPYCEDMNSSFWMDE